MLTISDARSQLLAAQAYERARLERRHAAERARLKELERSEHSEVFFRSRRSLCESAHKLDPHR